jgi:hypothetical protein
MRPPRPASAAADGFETVRSPNLSVMIGIRITAASPAEAQQVLSHLRAIRGQRDDPPATQSCSPPTRP